MVIIYHAVRRTERYLSCNFTMLIRSEYFNASTINSTSYYTGVKHIVPRAVMG